MRFCLVLLSLAVMPAFAQSGIRGDTNEFGLQLFVVGSKNYSFEGGATVRNDGGVGIGLFLAHNLNDYFAVGVEASVSQFDYRAGVAPAAGNAGAGYETSGRMETASARLSATWNLLARPVTPFITGGAGVTFLDTNLKADPPASGCWVYPWYGQVCSGTAPSNVLTRFSYNAGVGLRVDLPGHQGFLRVLAGGEWIAFSEALSPVGYVQLRADFGIKF